MNKLFLSITLLILVLTIFYFLEYPIGYGLLFYILIDFIFYMFVHNKKSVSDDIEKYKKDKNYIRKILSKNKQ